MLTLPLPPPSPDIRRAYRELVADIEAMTEKYTQERFRTIMQCGPGCADCCIRFSVLPLEAAVVAEALQGKIVLLQDEGDKCLLLSGDLCQVYEVRPVICRTQGLPLGYIDEAAGTIEVSACPLNFPEDYPLAHDDLLYMDTFNSRLAALNLQYCHAAGLNPERRIPLADLVAAD